MRKDGTVTTSYYAHSANCSGQRQDLVEHLHNVAKQAARFAGEFGGADLAYWIGMWHDLGKFTPEFQEYLLDCEANPNSRRRGPDHKAAGTEMAMQHLGLLALLIQAHHGGLKTPADCRSWLNKLRRDPATEEALRLARQQITDLEPAGSIAPPPHTIADPLAAEMLVRMLFSSLVDADRLDTEAHFEPERATQRGTSTDIAELWERFDRHHRKLTNREGSVVDRARREIYEACLAAADAPPGLFRLAVPTGGGKTLSGMAFALRHAMKHGLQLVIVAVPYISITEQTTDVYHSVLEADRGGDTDSKPIVLEHHSAAHGRAEVDEAGDQHPNEVWRRLAAENWDAPIVVTTTVQLFESLFANGTSRCRKLHRLAGSVIILDEAQALPAQLLGPILHALRQLCLHYRSTLVISTATQQAFDTIPVFKDVPAKDIVPEPERYFDALKRVEYEWRTEPALSWEEVAGLMRGEPQVLAVVNTKRDATSLLDALDDPDALHLSTSLSGAHRRRVIEEVKQRLAEGKPCRLVSTQVIEAGVDLDFPMVLRALGPLDGVIQAAGRCNREGKLERGRVIVFRPIEGGLPSSASYKIGTNTTQVLIGQALLNGEGLDPDDPANSREYFERMFKVINTDRENIQKLRKAFDYPEVNSRFRTIDDDTESVVITTYGSEAERREVRRLMELLREKPAWARSILRGLVAEDDALVV